MDRRTFVGKSTTAAAGTIMIPGLVSSAVSKPAEKLKVALVGTGIRGTSFWGRRLVNSYSDILEFVGLCDINPGRLDYSHSYIGADCPTFTDFDEMMSSSRYGARSCFIMRPNVSSAEPGGGP